MPSVARTGDNARASTTTPAEARHEGYVPIRSYAALGDGRTVALVARDGSIDWWCLPDLDSPSVFGALLDPDRGGRCALGPDAPAEVTRRYLPGTNVLETTFRTPSGAATVTDAVTVPGDGLSPQRELVRVVEGVEGRLPFRWSVRPAFGDGLASTRLARRHHVPVATSDTNALAVSSWDAGEPLVDGGEVSAAFETAPGTRAVIALSSAHGEPLVLPSRESVERRLSTTTRTWEVWTRDREHDGPWQEAVIRSALALKLLVYAPSGAVAAAPTTSLPEAPDGERNWDYRYCWVRDSAFTLNALLRLGCSAEADAFFWWLMQASQLTHPRLQVLYRLDGGSRTPEHVLPLAGYRHARPVRVGNAAANQLQLDTYGNLLETARLYAREGREIDPDVGRRLAGHADLVCEIWRRPDAGIWEVRGAPSHFTHSKVMCWVALDRAVRLAEAGRLPDRHAQRWQEERAAVRDFIETECWSETRQSYVAAAGSDDLDAAVVLAVPFGYGDPSARRLAQTVDAVIDDLGEGPFVYRYRNDDGLSGSEGAFLTCSFWVVHALALLGRRAEASRRMEELVAVANDVGLYAEEIEPATGEFLGNFPQGLTHLALINAAVALAQGEEP